MQTSGRINDVVLDYGKNVSVYDVIIMTVSHGRRLLTATIRRYLTVCRTHSDTPFFLSMNK